MMTFQEFLRKKAEEQHWPERQQRRSEWIAAVSRLCEQIRHWIAEADPEKILSVLTVERESAEPGLGAYQIPGLIISVGDVSLHVEPMGRNSIGSVPLSGRESVKAEGRVDITRDSRRYILYRTLEGDGEKWYVLDERFRAEPLDRHRLEQILQDLLS